MTNPPSTEELTYGYPEPELRTSSKCEFCRSTRASLENIVDCLKDVDPLDALHYHAKFIRMLRILREEHVARQALAFLVIVEGVFEP